MGIKQADEDEDEDEVEEEEEWLEGESEREPRRLLTGGDCFGRLKYRHVTLT